MAEEKDLKKEEDSSKGTGQPANESLEKSLNLSEDDKKSKEEDMESLPEWAKERLTKAERDRDNYKEATLKAKGAAKEEEEEPEEKETPDVTQIAEQAAEKVIQRRFEKEGIAKFLDDYPAYKEPGEWKKLITNLPSNFDKNSVESYTKALEGARLAKNHLEGKSEEEAKADLSEFATVTQKGSKSSGEEGTSVKESTLEMGQRFRHTPEKLKAEDDSQYAEIRL